jgi:hypothetical protein
MRTDIALSVKSVSRWVVLFFSSWHSTYALGFTDHQLKRAMKHVYTITATYVLRHGIKQANPERDGSCKVEWRRCVSYSSAALTFDLDRR